MTPKNEAAGALQEPEMKCLHCEDELRLEDIPGHLYAHGILPPWERTVTVGLATERRKTVERAQEFLMEWWKRAEKNESLPLLNELMFLEKRLLSILDEVPQ